MQSRSTRLPAPPDRFDGLVLSAPARTGRSERTGGFADACRSENSAAVDQFVSVCFPEPDSDHVKRWGRNILLRAEPEQAARMVEMWGDESVPDIDPRRIDAPTLILHGTADAIVSIEGSRQLVDLLPDAELLELDGSGHVPTMTRPNDVVDAIIRRFS